MAGLDPAIHAFIISVATLSIVIARLDRAIQYSRDACGSAERPRRTGSPAFAGD